MPLTQNKILVDHINKRMDDIITRRIEQTPLSNKTMHKIQQQACQELYSEMFTEGLKTTAAEILKYVTLAEGEAVIVKDGGFDVFNPNELIWTPISLATPKEYIQGVVEHSAADEQQEMFDASAALEIDKLPNH